MTRMTGSKLPLAMATLSLVSCLYVLLARPGKHSDPIELLPRASAPAVQVPARLDASADPAPTREMIGRGTPDKHGAFSVSVEDQRGQPVDECSVFIDDGAGVTLHGATDSEGRIQIHAPPPGAEVTCRASGYATRTLALLDHHLQKGSVTIQLVPGAEIHGRVVLQSGEVLGGRVRLAVVPADSLAPSTWFSRSADNPRANLCDSDESGNFRVGGLDPRREYAVLCAGAGYISTNPPVLARPDSGAVEVPVQCVYGLRLLLRDEDGAPPRTDPDLEWTDRTTLLVRDSKATSLVSRYHECALAEYDSPDRLERWGNEITLLYSHPEELDGIGPVEAKIHRPGYEEVHFKTYVERMSGRQLPEQLIRMKDDGSGFGKLTITTSGFDSTEPAQQSQSVEPAATLRLTDHMGEVMQINLWSLENSTFSVDVPEGDYTARLLSPFKFRHSSLDVPIPVSVVAGADSHITLDLSGMRRLQIRLFDQAGLEHRGSVVLRIRVGSNKFRHIRFRQAPYVLEGVPAGQLSLTAICGTEFPAPGRENYSADLVIPRGVANEGLLSHAIYYR